VTGGSFSVNLLIEFSGFSGPLNDTQMTQCVRLETLSSQRPRHLLARVLSVDLVLISPVCQLRVANKERRAVDREGTDDQWHVD